MKDKQVTISLSEYKELLLKERPNDNDKWLLGKIRDYICDKCTLDEDDQEIEITDTWNFGKDFLKFIKIIDLDFYKQLVKKCFDDRLQEEENKLKAKKMRKMKELNEEK